MKKHLLIFVCAIASSLVSAQTYKCKDASGNWTAAACHGVIESKKEEPKSKVDWEWRPVPGMKADDVKAVIDLAKSEASNNDKLYGRKLWRNEWFSRQISINRTVHGNSVSEQWVFKSYNTNVPNSYLYFTNGVLRSIQTSE